MIDGREIGVELREVPNGDHEGWRYRAWMVEWSPTFTVPFTPVTDAASPTSDCASVESFTVDPAPMIVLDTVALATVDPAPIATFGPMVLAVNVTLSSMYTGSTIVTPAGTD